MQQRIEVTPIIRIDTDPYTEGDMHLSGSNDMKDPVPESNLVDSGEVIITDGWLFSQGPSGGSRGCYHSVKVKIWNEV